MVDWNRIFKESPIDWLLEENNPSVCFFTLRDILDREPKNKELTAAKQAITESVTVKKILSKQNPDGSWQQPESPYLPKYKSTYWTIMTLAQLGMTREDKHVEKACQHIFQFQTPEGAFTSQTEQTLTQEYETRQKKGRQMPPKNGWINQIIHEQKLSCPTGNMTAALVRIGYQNDPHVKKALEWLVKIQNPDGGWLCPYWRAHVRDKHGCFYGTICPLEGFSETAEQNLIPEMTKAIEKGAEFLLMHRLFKADHHNYKVINQAWLKLGFPWYYGYNILRGLDVTTKLGYTKDERLNDAIEILMQKRQKNGSWLLETAPEGRMHTNLEAKGKPSKWITLIALRTLKRLSQD